MALRDLSMADLDELKTFAPPPTNRFGGEPNANQRLQMRYSQQEPHGRESQSFDSSDWFGVSQREPQLERFYG